MQSLSVLFLVLFILPLASYGGECAGEFANTKKPEPDKKSEENLVHKPTAGPKLGADARNEGLSRIEDLELNSRVASALREAGLLTVLDAAVKTEAELLEVPGIGGRSFARIQDAVFRFYVIDRDLAEEAKVLPILQNYAAKEEEFQIEEIRRQNTRVTKALRALKEAGLLTVGDVSGKTEAELLEVPGIGDHSIKLIQDEVFKFYFIGRGVTEVAAKKLPFFRTITMLKRN